MSGNKLLCAMAAVLLLSCTQKKGDYDASGIFEATEVLVSAQAGGQIMVFEVEEGMKLRAEQAVGHVDTTELHLKKQQLLAKLQSVSGRYVDVKRQIASLEEQVRKQKSEQQRFRNLVKANAANQKQLDDVDSQLQVLEKQLAAARETLTNNNEVVSGEAASLVAEVAQVDERIRKSIIRSPMAGTVPAKYAERGEVTTAGRPLFKVADMERMYLRAYITADQLTQMKPGEQVTVHADFGAKEVRTYDGVVSWISEKAEFTPKTIQTRNERANLVYAVKIMVNNDGYLKQGMYGGMNRR